MIGKAIRYTLGALLVSSTPALAEHWYVDATAGSDANGGTHPRDAWLTITHALATVPAPPLGGTQTIHVLPGTYDTALGEVFPLLPRDAFELVGDGGPDVTVLDVGGTGTAIEAMISHFGGNYTGPLTLVRGLRIEGADHGFDVQAGTGTEYLTIEECRIVGASVSGVRTLSGCVWGCGATEVKLRGVELVDCAIGVEFVQASQNLTSKLWISDARIVGSTDLGVSVYDTGGGSELELVRTSILLGSSDALRVVHDNQLMSNTTHAIVRDCLFAFHTGDGIKAELATDNIANSALRVEVERSTLAHNDHGIDAYAPTGWWPTLTVSLADSIVVGNLDDVYENPAKPAFDVVRYCDIGDGDFAGTNGNFAADPLFVDPSNLDYRLRWASPCIESGDPAGVAGDLDLAGNARPIDGDLDAQERFDLGAFEFAPLFLKSTGELGSPLALELWGPQANATTVYFARKPLVAPQLTPFGELDLDAAFMNVFRVTTVGSGPPKTIKRTIPNDPAFAGLVFSFQALTDCAAAPQGKAYTNAVELTLVP